MAQSVNFDRAVPYYDNTRGFPPGLDAQSAALIAQAADLKDTHTVLEIGIGTGRMALPLSTHVGTVYGADISTGMLGELLAKRTDERVFPTQADAARLPYPANSLDGVLVSHVFHLVADLPGVVAELERVLKPDGVVAHCWSHDGGALYPLRQAWRQTTDHGGTGDRWQIAQTILDDSGWTHRTTQTLDYIRQQTPISVIEKFERRIWSSTWHLTDAEHARGLAAMRAYLAANYDDPTAPIAVENTFHVTIHGLL